MKAMNRFARLATATGCLLWVGGALAQAGFTGAAGGPSDGYASVPDKDQAPSRQNTPTTGGGPTSQTSKSARDEAPTGSAQGSSMSTGTSSNSGALTGTISRVDPDNKTIELQGDRSIQVDPSTEIRLNGHQASFKDLHAGDDIRASFQGDDRTMVKRIDVMPNDGTSGTGSSTPSSSPSSTGR